tara:strand:+ start:279 stop:461 length:183 start_codon:yes stop_codon:yes gene_type:complete
MRNKMKNIEIVKEGFRNYVAIIDGGMVESTRTYNPKLAEVKAKNFLRNSRFIVQWLDKSE